jgi:hypothetical protein
MRNALAQGGRALANARRPSDSYPAVLVAASQYVAERLQSMSLSKENTDGRENSLMDERMLIACLKEKFRVEDTKPRYWYDTALYDEALEKWIPINIKTTRATCADNALNKKAIVFTFSKLATEDIPSNMSFQRMVELVESNIKEMRDPSHEYYYLYVDKKDKHVMVRSMHDVCSFRSNGNNWLQIDWRAERAIPEDAIPADDPPIERYRAIKGILSLSLQKLFLASHALLSDDDIRTLIDKAVLARERAPGPHVESPDPS